MRKIRIILENGNEYIFNVINNDENNTSELISKISKMIEGDDGFLILSENKKTVLVRASKIILMEILGSNKRNRKTRKIQTNDQYNKKSENEINNISNEKNTQNT